MSVHALFDTAALPVPDRLDAWRSAAGDSLIPTEIHSPQPARFAARLGAMALGAAQVTALAYTSMSSRRSPKSIRASDPEYYQVALIRSGRQGIDQFHASSVLRPGELVIYDSSQPFEAVNTGGMDPAESVILHYPKRLLPIRSAQVSRLCANPLPGTAGVGRLLSQLRVTLTDDVHEYTELDGLRLGHTAIDLTSAVLAHHLEQDAPPLRSASRTLY